MVNLFFESFQYFHKSTEGLDTPVLNRGKKLENKIKHANELFPELRQFIMKGTEQYRSCELFVETTCDDVRSGPAFWVCE